jgi:hypothetical protein
MLADIKILSFYQSVQRIHERLKMKNKWIVFLVLLLLLGCYSKKNKTEERAQERITQFVFLMANDKVEEAEELLATGLIHSGNKELFLSSFDNWQLKDTTDIAIEFKHILIPEDDPKNRALVSMTIRSEKNDFTKVISMPISYQKGDWYIGS